MSTAVLLPTGRCAAATQGSRALGVASQQATSLACTLRPGAALPRRAARVSSTPCGRARRGCVTVAVAAPPQEATSVGLFDNLPRSGMDGKALRFPRELPTKAQVLAAIPEHCFKRNTALSLGYAALSLALTLGTGALAAAFIPLQASAWPLWLAYALVNGTIATGVWVIAHECGHNAFSDNRMIQDAVGYAFHSALLVPYFSWQRSHAVHHARTNHVSEGETHCPHLYPDDRAAKSGLAMKKAMGEHLFVVVQLVTHLLVGWPAYLLWGATGGSAHGVSNHFWPTAPFSEALWPGSWKNKVWRSDIGVLAMLGILGYWAYSVGSMWPVLALYGAPYLVTNAWLVAYTWLQHTDTDVPHFESPEWSFVRGAFHTIDRPYGALFDFLHHRIGSTHVAHHVESSIPHYHALEATHALQKAFPDLYLYDPTPVHVALWRVASKCVAVERRGDRYVFIDQAPSSGAPAMA